MSFITQLLNKSIQKFLPSSSSEETGTKRKLEDELQESEAPVKKKKKNKNLNKENTESELDVLESEASPAKPKKKKKKKDKKREEESPTQYELVKLEHNKFKNEKGDKENSSKKKKMKKSKNREKGVTVSDQEENILGTSEVVEYEGDSAKSKKKKKDKKKIEIGLESFSRVSKSVKEMQGINSQMDKLVTENNISGTPSSHKHKTLIQDIYCPPEPAIITGQLYNAVMYILKENIPINNVNTVWTKNCQPHKETRDYLSKVYNVIFSFFTDEEDEKILTRFRYLVDNQIITKPKEFLKQLNDQNGMVVRGDHEMDKATRNIVGLYVGQDLPNRIAHIVTQRLVFLLTGTSLFNNYQTKSPVKTANTPEGPVYKTKQKLRYWTVDEDKILIETVLKDKSGRGFIPVEQLRDKEINWEEVAEYFVEFGRTRQLVRERWARTVKIMLLEGEQDIQERYDYQKYLLEYVIKLGVKDKKEIRWKEVAPVFAPKTSSVLSQDFWNLIRQKKNDTLAGKLENALECLERPTGKSINVNTKKNEAKSQLLDFYSSLSMRS